MKAIAVSGSVGSGKTTVAKKLAEKYNLFYFDINGFIKSHKFYDYYDKKRKTCVVDTEILIPILIKAVKDLKKIKIIFDGHFSHYIPKKYIKLCIICKCDLKVLKKRLEKRKYSKMKIRENLDAEIFDVVLNEAREIKHKIKIIDTTKGFNIKKFKT